MVEATLDKDRIEAGEALVRELDEQGLRPDAAFWLYDSEAQGWKLVLAEAKLKEAGPKQLYRDIQRRLAELPDEHQSFLTLADIAVAAPDSPIVLLLKTAIRTGPGISGIRFTNNVINGKLIEDAYIYRVS